MNRGTPYRIPSARFFVPDPAVEARSSSRGRGLQVRRHRPRLRRFCGARGAPRSRKSRRAPLQQTGSSTRTRRAVTPGATGQAVCHNGVRFAQGVKSCQAWIPRQELLIVYFAFSVRGKQKPFLRHPRERGDTETRQRRKMKTIGRKGGLEPGLFRIWVPAFAGMTERNKHPEKAGYSLFLAIARSKCEKNFAMGNDKASWTRPRRTGSPHSRAWKTYNARGERSVRDEASNPPWVDRSARPARSANATTSSGS